MDDHSKSQIKRMATQFLEYANGFNAGLKAGREAQIRSISAPESFADWPDLRVHCRDCGHKSGSQCIALKVSCNASPMPFYCDSFSPRISRLPARGA